MSNRSLPSGFLKTTLKNGVGRYVCQLQRITIKFCKEHGQSRGIRDFMENNILDFSKQNPSVAVYAQVKRHKNPLIVAEYLNGKTHTLQVGNKEADEVVEWLDWLRTRSGENLIRIRKSQHTDTPSIQGTWTPHTNKHTYPPEFTYPNLELSNAHKFTDSTTEILQKISKNATSL